MNMKLIDPSDPLYFRQTSDEPYDRHHYKLELSNGDYVIFEDYEQLRSTSMLVPKYSQLEK